MKNKATEIVNEIKSRGNDVVVFIRNIMDNVNYQDDYDKLVDRIDKSLRFVTRIQDGLKKDVEKKKDSSLQIYKILIWIYVSSEMVAVAGNDYF